MLDPSLEHMMEAVHRYEGTVNQVIGDGIMALFGAPLAHEDHAVRACYAALRMPESAKRYAEEARCTDGVKVQIRVGINSGSVMLMVVWKGVGYGMVILVAGLKEIPEAIHEAARVDGAGPIRRFTDCRSSRPPSCSSRWPTPPSTSSSSFRCTS